MSNGGSIIVNNWAGSFWYRKRVEGLYDVFVKIGEDATIPCGTIRRDREDDRTVYLMNDGRIGTTINQVASVLAREAAERHYR